jgi:hypothetical protein
VRNVTQFPGTALSNQADGTGNRGGPGDRAVTALTMWPAFWHIASAVPSFYGFVNTLSSSLSKNCSSVTRPSKKFFPSRKAVIFL